MGQAVRGSEAKGKLNNYPNERTKKIGLRRTAYGPRAKIKR